MKQHQKFKTWMITLGVFAFLTSCTKEPFESPEPDNGSSEEMVTNQPELPQDAGTGLRKTGCVLLSRAEYDKLPKEPESAEIQSLPSKFSLSCPPVRSQGSESSCVAWGTAYAARSIMAHALTGGAYLNTSNIMSPEFVYNQIKIGDCDDGARVVDALQLMMAPVGGGVCHWSLMAYNDTECSTMPNMSQLLDAVTHRITSYTTLTSLTASKIKNKLYDGFPVIVAGPVDANFCQLGSQVYSVYNPATFVGNHCYCIVGWDASKNAFKVMNSWGQNWGNNGFGWIHYSLIGTLFQEAYIIHN